MNLNVQQIRNKREFTYPNVGKTDRIVPPRHLGANGTTNNDELRPSQPIFAYLSTYKWRVHQSR